MRNMSTLAFERDAAEQPPPRTPSEFVQRLRDLRLWAGQPSLRRLQQLAGKTTVPTGEQVDALPRSTISTVLRSDKLPRAQFVEFYVCACLTHRNQSMANINSAVEKWLTIWRRLSAAVEPPRAPLRRPAATVPRQLPAGLPDFAGRQSDLAALDGSAKTAASGRAKSIIAITGMAGVGKSALALRWAHRTAARFPDGQLYLDLRGSCAEVPTPTREALGTLLRGLGMSEHEIPADQPCREGVYRSLLAGRRVLVVLDNALNAEHVRPLLPPGVDCLTLVTSRNRLSGLVAREGARRVRLEPLAPEAARQVLVSVIGVDRARGHEIEIDELASQCSYLPLALRIAGANLADRPERSIADYVRELRQGDRLGSLVVDGEGVRSALDASYRSLDRDAQKMFRQLARVRETDFTPRAVVGIPPAEARRLLHTLATEHLIVPIGTERFRLHGLLRDYAMQKAEAVTEATR